MQKHAVVQDAYRHSRCTSRGLPLEDFIIDTTVTRTSDLNLMRGDRIGYAVLGGLLLLSGAQHRGWLRAALGGTLLWQAYTGNNPLFRRLGIRVNPHPPEGATETIIVSDRIAIDAPRGALYRYWRNFANLPGFMRHLVAVRVIDERRSHWMAQAPAGQIIEWDAEITEEQPDRLLRWRSLPGAQIVNFGEVVFADAPAGRGTDVHVEIQYVPPAGSLSVALARYTGEEPQWQLSDDLRRLKSRVEAREIALDLPRPAGAAASSAAATQPPTPISS